MRTAVDLRPGKRKPSKGRAPWAKLPAVARVLDVFAVLLLLGAAVAFGFGLRALASHEDFEAIYLLVIGGFTLRASTEILRPRGSSV